MWHAVPVEDLLLLLCTNAIVLVQEVQEGTLWLFQRCICSRLQVAQVGEYALLELFRVLDRAAKCLEAECEASYNISARDVKEVVPV